MNWLKKFMTGRYGVDQLSWALLVISILISILSRILDSQVLAMLYIIPLGIVLYRMFSKDISKRYQENIKFLNKWNSIKRKINNRIQRIKGLKYYKYYKCSNCKQTLRVPRGKGKISITCPKCQTVMIKKS
ncbi:MAG: hypothetical protein GX023_03595 [Tissierellia bacterium]|nr:hypothetical protein [Tissierellia bacterium]